MGDSNETSLAESLISMTVDWRNVRRVLTELSAIRETKQDRGFVSLAKKQRDCSEGMGLSLIVVINVRCVAKIT